METEKKQKGPFLTVLAQYRNIPPEQEVYLHCVMEIGSRGLDLPLDRILEMGQSISAASNYISASGIELDDSDVGGYVFSLIEMANVWERRKGWIYSLGGEKIPGAGRRQRELSDGEKKLAYRYAAHSFNEASLRISEIRNQTAEISLTPEDFRHMVSESVKAALDELHDPF